MVHLLVAARARGCPRQDQALTLQLQASTKVRRGRHIGTTPVLPQRHPLLPHLPKALRPRRTHRAVKHHIRKPTVSGRLTTPMWPGSERPCSKALEGPPAYATRQPIVPVLRTMQAHTLIQVEGMDETRMLESPPRHSLRCTLTLARTIQSRRSSAMATTTATLHHLRT